MKKRELFDEIDKMSGILNIHGKCLRWAIKLNLSNETAAMVFSLDNESRAADIFITQSSLDLLQAIVDLRRAFEAWYLCCDEFIFPECWKKFVVEKIS